MCNLQRYPRAVARVATVLSLSALGGCASRDDAPARATERAATARQAESADAIVIDDFKTGPDTLTLASTGQAQRTQAGAGIRGGIRCVVLGVSGDEFGRSATAEIREGDPRGYFAFDSSVGVDQAVWLLYGYDRSCNGVGLDLDLSGMAGFRIRIAALDLGTAGAVAVFSDGGSSSIPLGIDAGRGAPGEDGFVKDVSRADFVGNVDWAHVQQIAFVIESGGAVAAHDYVLRSITAVPRFE